MRRVVISHLTSGESFVPDAESHHLLHVLRLREGDAIGLTDGTGGFADATIVRVVQGRALVRIGDVVRAPPGPATVVLLGMPKPALVEEAVMLGTEAGAAAFVLVRARYSPPGEPRTERLEKVVRAAVTQSGRGTVPRLYCAASIVDALVRFDLAPDPDPSVFRLPSPRYVGVPGAVSPDPVSGDYTVAIGPEGGWSTQELATLGGAHFQPVGLGPHILRAPTAVAIALGRLSRS